MARNLRKDVGVCGLKATLSIKKQSAFCFYIPNQAVALAILSTESSAHRSALFYFIYREQQEFCR
jgi:hypothetical protein